jgi:hypothetical protein
MFKKTSDRLTYVERVASHSTKERANGRIDMIPPDAELPVDYFNTLHDQYKNLCANYKMLSEYGSSLRDRLKQTLKYDEYRRIQPESESNGHQLLHIQGQLSELRKLIKDARSDAAFAFKWHMAKELLKADDIKHINEQCDLFVGSIMPISNRLKEKSTAERQGDSHANRAKHNKQSLHRRKSRKALETATKEGWVLYADSNYRQTDKPQNYRMPVVEVKPAKLQQLADHFNRKGSK